MAPGRHFVEHDAQTEQVRARVEFLAQRLFGRHVGYRSHRRTGTGQVCRFLARPNGEVCIAGQKPRDRSPRLRQLREAEIQNLHLPSAGDEDICRLDVPVNDPLRVRRVQGVGKLDAQFQNLVRLEGLRADAVLQRFALQQLHGDEGPAFLLLHVVDGADVGVIQA